MTRATLLRLLAHPTALNGADVRDLEELAEAFPYCQTAHLLLAKAAHDTGSMLAGQRLRRAATYVADRALLRRLIEAAPGEAVVESATAKVPVDEAVNAFNSDAEVPATTSADAADAEVYLARLSAPAVALPAAATPTLADKPAQEIGPVPAAPPDAAIAEEAASTHPAPATPTTPPATATHSAAAPTTADSTLDAPPEPAFSPAAATNEPTGAATLPATAAEAGPGKATETLAPLADAPETEVVSKTAADVAGIVAENQDTTSADKETPAATEPMPATEPAPADPHELPAQAPPVRLPAEAEAARQEEFGLLAEEPADVAAYQLPELELDITVPLAPAAATPRLPAFNGVPDVAYAPSEGSRYGFCLVPVAEVSEPLMPAASLPPPGAFFVPDALLLAHLAEPPTLPTSTTTDLINSFLQRAPSASRRRVAPPTPGGSQADLSMRSTRAAPDLASESLAAILARQGKTEQAIAVYERLMVKMPEKSSIFAAQIEALRPSA